MILKDHQFYANARAQHSKSINEAGLRGVYKNIRERVRLVGIIHRVYSGVRTHTNRASKLSKIDPQTEVVLELFNPRVQQTSDEWQQAWGLTEAILMQFAKDVANDEAEFHIVIASGPLEINEETRNIVLQGGEVSGYDWQLPYQLLEAMLAQRGLSYTNLFPTVEAASRESTELMHFIRDGHYTPAGHQVVATELLPVLQS